MSAASGRLIPFFQQVLEDEEFQSGAIDTDFVERFQKRTKTNGVRADDVDKVATRLTSEQIAAAFAASADFARKTRTPVLPSVSEGHRMSRWKLEGRMSGVKSK